MSTWRIETLYDNRSATVQASSGSGVGATVVRAERSLEEPIQFNIGETQRMMNMLGAPTSLNPDLLEALEYVKSYPLYVASPSILGVHSGVLLGATGTTLLGDGIRGTAKQNLADVTLVKRLGQTGTSFVWTGIIARPAEEYIAASMKLFVNGEEQAVTVTAASTETFVGIMLDAEIGSVNEFDPLTKVVTFTFIGDGTAPVATDTVEVLYEANLSDNYMMLTSVGASTSAYLSAQLAFDTVTKMFSLDYKVKNSKGVFNTAVNSPIEFSTVAGAVNGFNVEVYADTVFDGSDYFVAHLTGGAALPVTAEFVDDLLYVAITGGAHEIADVDYTTGYEFFNSTRQYQADVFFDATADSTIPALFATLRDTYQKYSRYLIPVANVAATAAIELVLPVRNRGLSYYWGWFKMLNMYNTTGAVVSTPMGEVAKANARIVVNAFGGLAPAWINENGMGGQLTGGRIIKAMYDVSDAQTKSLDEACINPIVYDPSFGPMIISRRTSVSGLSDYSFIDYVGALDYIVSNIVRNVLPYQIVKMNDSSHRTIVTSKANGIIQPMTIAPRNVIDSYAIQCDSSNNTDVAKAREEFVLDIAVKVTSKSRVIKFTIINTAQTSTVTEELA